MIAISGLSFGYGDGPLVFDDFAFASEHPRVLIRGPSGCGKTTLLKIIAGLVRVRHGVIERPKPDFTVLQSDGLVPWLTGRQNIELVSAELWTAIRASALFDLISPFADRRAVDLSFGQRRSVELVRALVSQRPLLLLDEPLNFLDRGRRELLLAFLDDETQCVSSFVMTSHYEDGQSLRNAAVFEFAPDPPHRTLMRL